MNLLLPRPDEHISGLVARQMRANANRSIDITEEQLRLAHGSAERSGRKLPLFAVLADLFGLDKTRFVQAHTLIPVFRVAHPTDHPYLFGDITPRALPRDAHLDLKRGSWRLCPDCVREDIDFWGDSYWRKSHQLPGIRWCVKHGTHLLTVHDMLAIECSPDEVVMRAESHHIDELSAERGCPLIRHIAVLMEDAMQFDSPLNPTLVAPLLRERAKAIGLRVARGGRRPTLTDLAREKLPPHWLKVMFPSGGFDKPNSYDGPLQCALRPGDSGYPSAAFFVALALLFRPDEDVFGLLRGDLTGRPEPPPRTKPFPHREDRIRRVYVQAAGNPSKIALQLGAGTSGVRQKLTQMGLPSLARASPELVAAVEAFANGESIADACASFNLQPSALENILRIAASRNLKMVVRARASQKPSLAIEPVKSTSAKTQGIEACVPPLQLVG